MRFLTSRMYCKYVIDTLSDGIKNLRQKHYLKYDVLEDKLYESYIKLEKILNTEFF